MEDDGLSEEDDEDLLMDDDDDSDDCVKEVESERKRLVYSDKNSTGDDIVAINKRLEELIKEINKANNKK